MENNNEYKILKYLNDRVGKNNIEPNIYQDLDMSKPNFIKASAQLVSDDFIYLESGIWKIWPEGQSEYGRLYLKKHPIKNWFKKNDYRNTYWVIGISIAISIKLLLR